MFSDYRFVFAVIVAYVLMHVVVVQKRTALFAVINMAAIIVLFKLKAALLLLGVASCYWLLIWLVVFCVQFKSKSKHAQLWRLAGHAFLVICIIGLFLLNKLSGFSEHAMHTLASYLGVTTNDASQPISAFLGMLPVIAISYVCLRLIDVVRAVFDGDKLLNPFSLSGYLVPFFMTPAGPINVYTKHLEMDERPSPTPTFTMFVDAVFLVALGYFMKFFIATSYQGFLIGYQGQWQFDTVWDTYLFLVYVFFEFCGYSFIALGVGRLLGVPTPLNFNHPYIASNFGDFWARWHMSLGDFAKRNIYNPLLITLIRQLKLRSTRSRYAANVFALWAPFVFIGFWHDVTLGFLVWGIVVGALVAAEKALRDKPLVINYVGIGKSRMLTKVLGIVYVQALVAWTLHFAIQDFPL